MKGNLTILGTGSGTTRHAFTASVNTTVSIGGDFIVTGGNFWLSSTTGVVTATTAATTTSDHCVHRISL